VKREEGDAADPSPVRLPQIRFTVRGLIALTTVVALVLGAERAMFRLSMSCVTVRDGLIFQRAVEIWVYLHVAMAIPWMVFGLLLFNGRKKIVCSKTRSYWYLLISVIKRHMWLWL
jgi:hypothetical protein